MGHYGNVNSHPRVRFAVAVFVGLAVFLTGASGVVSAQTPGPSLPARPPPVRPLDPRVSDRSLPVYRAASDAESYAEQTFADSFGGVYLEATGTAGGQQGNNAHVLLKDRNPAVIAQIRQNARFPERLVFEQARFSRKELRALQTRIVGDFPTLATRGVTVASVGERTDVNQLQVDVVSTTAATTAAATTTLTQLYGGDAIRVVAVPSLPSKQDRATDGYPLKAGYQITSQFYACTEGFMGYTSTNYVVLTAGHCGGVGTTFSHAGVVLGNVSDQRYQSGSRLDAASIPIANSPGQVSSLVIKYYPDVGHAAYVETQQLVNKVVCHSGITSQERCGTVDMVHVTVNVSGVVLNDQVRAFGGAPLSQGGDSGGPWYTANDGYNLGAEGIHSAGGCGPTGETYSCSFYSFAANIQPDMGISIYVG